MNEGIVAIILQWSMLCLIWMGSLDGPLRQIGLGRRSALAFVTAWIVCSFSSWQLYFLPVHVNVGGVLVPLLFAGWCWAAVPKKRRMPLLIATFMSAVMVFVVRKMLFFDPVLLVLEDTFLVPIVVVVILYGMTRSRLYHFFMLLLALPLSDALYMLSYLDQLTDLELGSGHAQDMFWLSFALWGVATVVWLVVYRGGTAVGRMAANLRVRSKTNPNR
ncbi:YphA family membrane protein [Brevibacillus dissolubilis]|uniref:YphA family membrane protein n=1 Tax=Brevibacillus dissolubilis TaxID=1844116 RepID=UPI0011178B8D|nr:hypothetical protein [Brevibacillus dissolubilis]